MSIDFERVCAYCAEQVLDGTEPPEHAFPAAINARFTTRAVCRNCNSWAGKRIDHPWLTDTMVGHARFVYAIPDPNRRGKVLETDPLLRGVTADGTHVAMGRDGVPIVLNSPVIRDDETGTIQIRARDQRDLERLVKKERRRAESQGKTFKPGESTEVASHPEIRGSQQLSPGVWQRMAAKATLALLARTMPADWRMSRSAEMLRTSMRDFTLTVGSVNLRRSDAVVPFAPQPSSAVVIFPGAGSPAALVSLLGIFSFRLALGEDMTGTNLAWVSDPLSVDASCHGTFENVVAQRTSVV
jgi:hypothetical protein